MLKSQSPNLRIRAEYLVDTFGESPNIEDLITQMQTTISALKGSHRSEDIVQRQRLGNGLGALRDALGSWFREIRTASSPNYAAFAQEVVQSGDTVITFNYDDSLERELRRAGKWDISQGYGFPLGIIEYPSTVRMLKLHGSINWLVSVFGGAVGGSFFTSPRGSSLGDHPVIHEADLKFLEYEDFQGHTYRSGGAFPCLILPGRTKEFFYDTSFGNEYGQFWDHLWSQASDAVKRCQKIVICGYSLLPVDQRACELLLKRPRKETRVEVVCGGQTERIIDDFRNAGFNSVTSIQRYFKEWVRADKDA